MKCSVHCAAEWSLNETCMRRPLNGRHLYDIWHFQHHTARQVCLTLGTQGSIICSWYLKEDKITVLSQLSMTSYGRLHHRRYIRIGQWKHQERNSISIQEMNCTIMNFFRSYSFIPLACAQCNNSLPFSGASSIPLCYVLFPATLLHQLFIHPLSPHLSIYFLVYLSILLFPNSGHMYIVIICWVLRIRFLENFAATPQRMWTCQLFLFFHIKTRLFQIIVGPIMSIPLECIATNHFLNNLTNCTNISPFHCLSQAKSPAYWHLLP